MIEIISLIVNVITLIVVSLVGINVVKILDSIQKDQSSPISYKNIDNNAPGLVEIRTSQSSYSDQS